MIANNLHWFKFLIGRVSIQSIQAADKQLVITLGLWASSYNKYSSKTNLYQMIFTTLTRVFYGELKHL